MCCPPKKDQVDPVCDWLRDDIRDIEAELQELERRGGVFSGTPLKADKH